MGALCLEERKVTSLPTANSILTKAFSKRNIHSISSFIYSAYICIIYLYLCSSSLIVIGIYPQNQTRKSEKKAETQNKTEIKSQTQNILRNTHKKREKERSTSIYSEIHSY